MNEEKKKVVVLHFKIRTANKLSGCVGVSWKDKSMSWIQIPVVCFVNIHTNILGKVIDPSLLQSMG